MEAAGEALPRPEAVAAAKVIVGCSDSEDWSEVAPEKVTWPVSDALALGAPEKEGSDVTEALDEEDAVDDFEASDDAVELGEP